MGDTRRLPSIWRSRYAGLLAALATVGLTQAALSMALALGMAPAFDFAMEATRPTPSPATILAAGFLIFAGISSAARYAERTLSERLGQRYVHSVRMALWNHLERLPATRITSQRRGATVLRFLGDLTTLKVWVSRGLAGSAVAVSTLAGGIAALGVLNGGLAIYALLIVAITVAAQARWNRVVQRRVRELRRMRSRLATDIVERISCLSVIQSSNQGRRERKRVRRRSKELLRSSIDTASASGILLGGGEFSSVALMGGVLVLGAAEVSSGVLTPGALVAGLLLARHLGRPVRRLSRTQEQWLRAQVARRKIEQFLALDPLAEPRRGVPLKPGTGVIRLTKVAAGKALLRVSARAQAGERIRLVGVNGAGKSTLLRLLAGLERPQSGRISLDGRDLGRCRLETIRSAVSLVGPDLPLMRGTLRRNVTYRSPGVKESQLREVLEVCDLLDLVASLPRGLGTRVADGGLNFSSGERHRIELARALLGEPRVLLLDEADRFLDARGRLAIRRVLDSFAGTVVFVWNGSDAPLATSLWEMRDGEIEVADGHGLVSEATAVGPSRLSTNGGLREQRICAV